MGSRVFPGKWLQARLHDRLPSVHVGKTKPPVGTGGFGRAVAVSLGDQKSKRSCSCARSTSLSSISKRLYSPRSATLSVKRYCRPRP